MNNAADTDINNQETVEKTQLVKAPKLSIKKIFLYNLAGII